MNKERHILGISGGKDSAALAVYMSQKFPDLDLEYFFTDTGEELPEVYDYLTKLEGYLGKQITRLNPSRNFQHHLKIYGYWLPSAQQRWCTDKLKIKPLEQWIKPDLDQGIKITSYVAIRYDEKFREGHQSKHKNYTVKLPFMDDKIEYYPTINTICGNKKNELFVGLSNGEIRCFKITKQGITKEKLIFNNFNNNDNNNLCVSINSIKYSHNTLYCGLDNGMIISIFVKDCDISYSLKDFKVTTAYSQIKKIN